MTKTKHPLYSTWKGMRARCNDPNHVSYPNYGGRGITVCERWDDFWLFVEDMGVRPDGYTIERVKSHIGYQPDNCVWTSRLEQNQHRSSFIGTFKPSKDPMRFISKRNGNYTLQMSLGNGSRLREYNLTLDEALRLRADIEMEREMYKRLS